MEELATPQTVRGAFRKFFLWTSVRGVPRIFKEVSLPWRVIWAIAVLTFLGLSLNQVCGLFIQYLKHETTQRQVVVLADKPIFPSITFCNQQPFTGRVKRLRKRGHLLGIPTMVEHIENVEKYIKHKRLSDGQAWLLRSHLISISGYYQNNDLETVETIAQSAKEFIPGYRVYYYDNDSLKTVKGNGENATIVSHSEFLHCFTISVKNISYISRVSVVLFLDDYIEFDYPLEYANDNSDRFGIKVLLHPDDTYPIIDQDLKGWGVQPGVSASFLLRLQQIELMEPPYGMCTKNLGDITTADGRTYRYSRVLCEELCRQMYMIDRCMCLDPKLQVPKHSVRELNYCGKIIDDVDQLVKNLKCMTEVREQFYKLVPKDFCSCPWECEIVEYKPFSTVSRWPHESLTLSYVKLFKEKFPYLLDEDTFSVYSRVNEALEQGNETLARLLMLQQPMIQRNLIRVTVAYPEKEVVVQRVEQVPVLPKEQLPSNIGGALSFWLGITIVTLIELLQLCYEVLFLSCKLIMKHGAISPVNQRPNRNVNTSNQTDKKAEEKRAVENGIAHSYGNSYGFNNGSGQGSRPC